MLEIIKTKLCNKCKNKKDILFFGKSKDRLDSLQPYCKQCRREHAQLTKEKISEYHHRYNIDNKVDKAKKAREYYQKNKIRIIERVKKYRLENLELVGKRKRIYNENNKEKIAERRRNYLKTPNGRASDINKSQRRRADRKQGDVTTNQMVELQQNAKVCYWCNKSLKNIKVHIDHYIPLSRGGKHTLSNLVVSCQRCNNKKHAKDPIEFANSIGKLL